MLFFVLWTKASYKDQIRAIKDILLAIVRIYDLAIVISQVLMEDVTSFKWKLKLYLSRAFILEN